MNCVGYKSSVYRGIENGMVLLIGECIVFDVSAFVFTDALIIWHHSLQRFVFGVIFSNPSTVSTVTGRHCGLPSLKTHVFEST